MPGHQVSGAGAWREWMLTRARQTGAGGSESSHEWDWIGGQLETTVAPRSVWDVSVSLNPLDDQSQMRR